MAGVSAAGLGHANGLGMTACPAVGYGSSQSQLWGAAVCGRTWAPTAERQQRARSGAAAVRASKSGEEGTRKEAMLERRQLLVASTAVLSAAGLLLPDGRVAMANPVKTDYSCHEGYFTLKDDPTRTSVNCCTTRPPPLIKDFVFPDPAKLPIRTRRPAHLLTTAEIKKYNKAWEAIRALPDEHPHSWKAQAAVHCIYCNFGLYQEGFEKLDLQIHSNWLFTPFHRWELYFLERILAKYADDDTLAIPYWNNDNQDPALLPNAIPDIFLNPAYPGLGVDYARRNRDHYPPNIMDFTRGAVPQSEGARLRQCNERLLHQNIVQSAKTASLFHGGEYRAGDAVPTAPGALESLPHGPPHGWVGSPVSAETPGGEDMGNFYSSGRDPVFFSHHCNVDRFWVVWRDVLKRKDFDDPDWLGASFLFYDENEELVRVTTEQSLDPAKLRFQYEAAPDKWLQDQDYETGKRIRPKRPDRGQLKVRTIADAKGADGADIDIGGAAPSSFAIGRPDRPKRRSGRRGRSGQPLPSGASGTEEEILVIRNVTFPAEKELSLDVFVNLDPADDDPDPCDKGYIGTFFNVRHAEPGKKLERTTTLRFGIGSTLDRLGITDTSNLTVTVVPREGDEDENGNKPKIVFSDVTIEYE